LFYNGFDGCKRKLKMSVDRQAIEVHSSGLDAVTQLSEPDKSLGAVNEYPQDSSIVGDYVILKEIARGGMGIVYLAKHRHLGREVALKTLLLNCGSDKSTAERFAVEAQAVARLDHPGIITIFEIGDIEGQPYLAMKFVEGGNLAKLLYQGPLDCERTLTIAIEVADAISHAHQRGVIHRDLKPANILLDNAGHAIVTDFGVAKLLESVRCQLTTAGDPIGTPHYMPPEQADTARGQISPSSDVYSIGAVMYAMLTGRPPFQAASPLDVMLQVLQNDPVPPKKLNATVPSSLDAIVMKCLQKDMRKRYQTATALREDLCNFRDGKPTTAKPIGAVTWLLYSLRKHFMVATVSGSIVMLLLLATAVILISYVKLLNTKVELEGKVADLTDVLSSERDLFRTRVSAIRNNRVSEASLIAERLASYSWHIHKQNPDLAARLAIESIKQTQEMAQASDQAALNTLQAYLATRRSDSQTMPSLGDAASTSDLELIAEVEKILTYQLSEEQKMLFGIESNSQNSQ
jgi:serine/threonine protein kinase